MFASQEAGGNFGGVPWLPCDVFDEVSYHEARYQPKEVCKELHK
jgi:hypothetical protein